MIFSLIFRALSAFFIILFLSGCGRSAKPLFYIDLQNAPLYLKAGFSPSDTATPDLHDGSWRILKKWTNAIVHKIEKKPKRAFLSPFGRPPEEWTFAIPFHINTKENEPVFPGLFLAGIGDNWEVYLNGELVRREMNRDEQGRIREHHSRRDVFFPLKSALFHEGENLLAFRIAGDPTDVTVGFQYSAPYYIADYEYIARENSEILEFTFIGVYLLVGIYHFFLFALQPKERYNGLCGFFALSMGLYYLFRTHGIYNLIPDTLIVVKLEFFFVFLAIPLLGAFTELLCLGKIGVFTKIFSGFFTFLAVSQLIFPHPYGSDTLIVWQVLGIPALLRVFLHNLLSPFIREAREKGVLAALRDTYPGNLVLGVGVFAASALADMCNALFLHYTISFTRYSLCAFMLSMAFLMARLYSKLKTDPAVKNILPEADEAISAARERFFKDRGLTNSEIEIAHLMLAGYKNTEIAGKIFRSRATVEFHVTNIYRKFGIDGKTNGRAAFMSMFMQAENRGASASQIALLSLFSHK